jgi:hypothetical protein
MYWKVEPSADYDYGYQLMPANTNMQNHEALLQAQMRLEELWDKAKVGDSFIVTISLHEGEMPEVEE